MNNNSKALKSGVWYTASNFFLKAVGFITIPIFTRLLSKEEFGMFNNYTSWISIALVLITLRLDASLMSAKYDFEDDFDSYILSMVSLNVLVVCTWSIVINVFSSLFVKFTHLELIYLNAMMLYLLSSAVVDLFQARERYLYKYKVSVLLSVCIAMMTAVLSLFLVLNMDNRLTGRILGTVIPVLLAGIVIVLFLAKKGKKINLRYWLYALPICLPYVPHLLAGSLLNSVDRVMIERICGSEDTAIYSLAYNCGAIVTLLISSLNSAFSPWLGEMLHYKNYVTIRKFSKEYISVFVALTVVFMIIAPEILYVLGGEPYMEAKYVITPVALGCVCQFLYTMYVNVEQFLKKTVGMAVATVVAAALNYGLNVTLIPLYGYLVAAYTTLIGFLALLFIHIYLVKRMGFKEVYDTKFVLLVLLVGIIIMFGVTMLYSFTFERYIILTIYLLFISVIGYRKRVIVGKIFKQNIK